MPDDQYYMAFALEEARKAYECNEVPIGAIVVSGAEIIGVGRNSTEECYTQSRHAEVIAVEQAGKSRKDWRLAGCTLYVTLQPCIMCMGLLCLSRIERLVYGAESPLFGYHLDKELLPALYKKHMRGITSGVLGEASQNLLEKFFREKRIVRE